MFSQAVRRGNFRQLPHTTRDPYDALAFRRQEQQQIDGIHRAWFLQVLCCSPLTL
jgi:hypothetical protein